MVSLYLYVHMLSLIWEFDLVNELIHQAGLFSAALTAFIIDRSQNIQQTPAQQSVFFQQQSVALLNQISQQLSSLGAQTPVSSNLSLSGPAVTPSSSDVRVNVFWFLSLVFSLSAALLATLVQRSARDHMHIFRRYSHPLRIARIRQYLHEGVESWYMPAIAEAVPGLIHFSLLLFLIGLADFLLHTHTIVGKFTVVPMSLCAALYIISTVAPVISPKCPYRTSSSRFVWYLYRKICGGSCKDRFSDGTELLSSNMAEGQMQLAMEKNDARKGRDERAIRWLVDKLTGDIEMESLASGIPGSFDAKWGVEVWKNDPAVKKDESSAHNSTGSQVTQPNPSLVPLPVCGEVVGELCQRLQRLFETCNHRGSFVNEEEWRKRSRVCVETAASFVFCMDADIHSFGEIGKLLSDLGNAENTRNVSATSLNRSFATRWTCISLVATRKMLHSYEIRRYANGALLILGAFSHEGGFIPSETAVNNAKKIDCQLAAAWDCVEELLKAYNNLKEEDRRVDVIDRIFRRHKPELKEIQDGADRMKLVQVDERISRLQKQIDRVTHNLIRRLPGITFDDLSGPVPIGQVFDFLSNPIRPQLIYMSQRLLGLCTLTQKRSGHGYQGTIKILKTIEKTLPTMRAVVQQHHLMERQLWRLQDLSIGGAFGFTLELYFLSLKKILSTYTSPPGEIHILGAFKAITSDWEQFKNSPGTLQIILNMVCDIAVENRGILSNFTYPEYITKELLELLGRMVEGQDDCDTDPALNELLDVVGWRVTDKSFRDGALKTMVDSWTTVRP